MTTRVEEVSTTVAHRFPPGDRWSPVENTTLILDSLTDLLEYVYQKHGHTQFYIDAKEGTVYIITSATKEIPPEPVKEWSLYGEG